MKFIKMTGTGNDFLIADLRSAEGQQQWADFSQGRPLPQVAEQLCHRQQGVGADGLVLIKTTGETGDQEVHFTWDFYNSDGSHAEMCGNAARCVSRWYADQLSSPQEQVRFQTRAGVIRAKVHPEGYVSVEMSPLKVIKKQGQLTSHGQSLEYSFVNSGVPHVVLLTEGSFDFQKMKPVAEYLRNHPEFGPEGTNVTFVRELSEDEVHGVSFERGVEDFTLACGTGAVAAAWAHRERYPGSAPVQVHLPGGSLTVSFQAERPILYGPTRYVAEIRSLNP